jgi:hypothetical protein
VLNQLRANLIAGFRLACFLPVRAQDFYLSADQLVLLALVQLLAFFVSDVAVNGFPGEFELSALPAALFIVSLLMFAGYAISRWQRDRWLALAVPVVALSVSPVFAALYVALFTLTTRFEALAIVAAWGFHFYLVLVLAVYARGLFILAGKHRLLANTSWMLGLALLPQIIFPRGDLWVAEESAEDASLPAITDEAVFHSQGALLERTLTGLQAERPGIVDLYFVGFAGDSTLDVFMKELVFARDLFDSRFDTKGRSVVLINNRATLSDTAIATATHLARAIDAVSRKMNREEDILLIFMTSHGAETHELSVVFDPMDFAQIDAAFLHEQLARAGIGWRVVVISACYSGGFVAPLENDRSLIITAADADHPSFGCTPDADFTYFGRAFFAEELAQTFSLTTAFEKAIVSIAQREHDKGYEASRPQIAMGTQMKTKLDEFEARLKVSTVARE